MPDGFTTGLMSAFWSMSVSEENPRNQMKSYLSRRDFLKACSLGMASLILPPKLIASLDNFDAVDHRNWFFGRVTQDNHPLYRAPTTNSEMINELPVDSVHIISAIKQGMEDTSANSTWYQLGQKGYAHSKQIQPVRIKLNQPKDNIPEEGCLGEITIPFVDALSSINTQRKVIYRFYYASTHWVLGYTIDDNGLVWYSVLDDYFHRKYYIPSICTRLIPNSELTALSPEVPFDDKTLVVDLEKQSLTASIKDNVIKSMRISSGARLPEGGSPTPRGNYRIMTKRPCRHIYAPPSEFGSGYDLPGVPWVSYFTGNGIALHGTYWHNNFGVPNSHGCINLSPQDAKWIYRWTTPPVPPDKYFYFDYNGTRINIF